MGQLFFKKPFQLAIRAGTKTTTIRCWPAGRPLLRRETRVFALGIGWLAIDAVDGPINLDALTDSDAAADGFETVELLRAALESLYPERATDGKAWFRVRFHLDASSPRRDRPKNRANASKAANRSKRITTSCSR